MRYFMILFCLIASVAVGSFARPASDGGEVVICGKVLNRDFYPNEREFRLSLSYFSGQDICYTTPLRDDGSFFFRFPLCDALCEVSLANYAPRLYVSAGDSLYLQIDFKDLLHPVVKGSRAALNQGMQHFVGEGYYLPDYSTTVPSVSDMRANTYGRYLLRNGRTGNRRWQVTKPCCRK